MAKSSGKPPMKSVSGSKPLRSRGFLSQPQNAVPDKTGAEAASSDAAPFHKSRGSRSARIAQPGTPSSLADKPIVRPYKLVDE